MSLSASPYLRLLTSFSRSHYWTQQLSSSFAAFQCRSQQGWAPTTLTRQGELMVFHRQRSAPVRGRDRKGEMFGPV